MRELPDNVRMGLVRVGTSLLGAAIIAAVTFAGQSNDKIKELQGKGLITEEEAKKAREHILNDL